MQNSSKSLQSLVELLLRRFVPNQYPEGPEQHLTKQHFQLKSGLFSDLGR